ncbi:RNA polymerase recycling motor HelD [Peribacillus acanthi]|uniref:RNA polymerase recycling motor HelD n=1 Tax=Peribacillus acanthi TaxID=2171554 RepID=UPI000D3E833F|nr:RNA polymerase recycling motor HelD [Peribacillus acanthi]
MEKKQDWIEETKRLQQVLNAIDQQVYHLSGNLGEIKEDIIDMRKTFWDDVTVNVDNFNEIIETYHSIKQRAELLAERERSHKHHQLNQKRLEHIKSSPYFGRIDFQEDGDSTIEDIYIGIAALMDEKGENFLIHDWRAPISSMFYDYPLGKAKFEAPGGTITGNLLLKRQYLFKNGSLRSMFDSSISIGDELLKEVLGDSSSTAMKNIVATIQREQNAVIRNTTSKMLVVQGVAGSGKTSAALQRVAYLLYRYRSKLDADQILLFSPNLLFSSYVSTVLPELGEENMQQLTYQEYVNNRLGSSFEIEGPFSQLEEILTSPAKADERLTSIRIKASMDFQKQLDEFILTLNSSGIHFKSILFRGQTLISSIEILNYFYQSKTSLPISDRLRNTAKWLLRNLKRLEEQALNENWVQEEVELLQSEDYLEAYKHVQKHQQNDDDFANYDNEQMYLHKMVTERAFKPLYSAVKSLKFLKTTEIYFDFLRWTFNLPPHPEKWKKACLVSIEKMKNRILPFEDTAPYLYLIDRLIGKVYPTPIRHLFIDEAQDYSPFQFAYFRQLFPVARMTILGDRNQAIYAHSLNNDSILNGDFFSSIEHDAINFSRTYRSTKQIVNVTKWIIDDGENIEPFNRNGLMPTLTITNINDEHSNEIISCVEEIRTHGHATIAIICKTVQECREAYGALKDKLDLILVDQEARSFDKGVILLPSYMAKGIEFDAVIIYDASEAVYGKEFERKLFYTACTRAMHELHVFSRSAITPFWSKVPQDNYILKK